MWVRRRRFTASDSAEDNTAWIADRRGAAARFLQPGDEGSHVVVAQLLQRQRTQCWYEFLRDDLGVPVHGLGFERIMGWRRWPLC